MKSTKRAAIIMAIFCVSLWLSLTVLPTSTPAQEVIEIKASTIHPLTHRITDDSLKLYGNEIEKRTHGKVKFKWFFAESLVPMFKNYDAVKSGLCDWGYFISSLNQNEFAVTNYINLPFAALSSSHAAAIAWKMYHEIPEMRQEFKNVHPLFFFSTPVQDLAFKGPAPKKLEDLKGLRIGVVSPVVTRYLNTLGASAQQMPQGDLYTSLQRGMIDGVAIAKAPMKSLKLTDLAGHHTMVSIGVDLFVASMNINKWNSLPPDVKKVFEDVSESAGAQFAANLDEECQSVIDELKKRGDEFYYVPSDERERWKKALQPEYDAWVKRVGEKGANGAELLKKVTAISDEALKKPYPREEWWGRVGRK